MNAPSAKFLLMICHAFELQKVLFMRFLGSDS